MKPAHALPILLVLASLAPGLVGCSEMEPRRNPERAQLYNGTSGESPLLQRTLKQGESIND